MGDKATLARARQELEDLYLGVPDESVNVTLRDMAALQHGAAERKTSNLDVVHETSSVNVKEGLDMSKSPSLDFRKGLQAAKEHRRGGVVDDGEIYTEPSTPNAGPRRNKYSMRNTVDDSLAYNDVSMMSRTSQSPYEGRGGGYEERGRRRPGIPHTNICTICSEYIYIFRHRCLLYVCKIDLLLTEWGRSVYAGMRKGLLSALCECGHGRNDRRKEMHRMLGKKIQPKSFVVSTEGIYVEIARYIKRAGQVGCCTGYPRTMKQQELVWAEKGPRRSGERRYGRSGMVSRSRSPAEAAAAMPTAPTRVHVSSPPSFVMQSSYSPHHAIPF
ncbi:hypothetical protein ACLOJK_031463 [Asimina triloba]